VLGRRQFRYAVFVFFTLGFGSAAFAEEPGENEIQDLMQKEAQSVALRFPVSTVCFLSEGALIAKKPDTPGGNIQGPAERMFDQFGRYCKVFQLLAKGDLEVRKAGCTLGPSNGVSCDFLIQLKAGDEEQAALFSQFFPPTNIYSARFVPLNSKWYLDAKSSPFSTLAILGYR
jgi:hypothetical protein